MTIYLVALFSLMVYGMASNHNLTDKKRKKYIIVSFGSLALIAMLRRYTVGRDLEGHYYNTFLRVVNMDWKNLYMLGYENGYLTFYKLICLFTKDGQWMIAIHALFVVGVTGWFIYRNSENVVISTFLFITTNTWFMYMNVMRQAMAVSIVLIAIESLKRKNLGLKRYVWYYATVFLAIQFHSSAAIALFIPIFDYIQFKKKEMLTSAIVMIASFFLYNQLFRLLSFLPFGKRNYTEFYSNSGEVINITTLYFIFVYILIFIFGLISLVYYHRDSTKDGMMYIHEKEHWLSDSFLLYMVLLLIICRVTGLRINVMSRMTYFFLPFIFILFPRALNHFRNQSNRIILRYSIYFIMTTAFIWLGYRNGALLYGTVPYAFFWK